MKNRLNITIDEKLVRDAKRYAARNKISLSQLIEGYLKQLISTKPSKKNILELLDGLRPPKGAGEKATVKRYYEDRKSKYGF
jgi:antitoxin component of RelBE/YafQ-DinJ toxin-antitoxin module